MYTEIMPSISYKYDILNEVTQTGADVDISPTAAGFPKILKDAIIKEGKANGIPEDKCLVLMSNYIKNSEMFDTGEGVMNKVAITGRDPFTAIIERNIEAYDVALDKAILASDDLVKAYNAMCEAQYDKTVQIFQKLKEEQEKTGIDPAGTVEGFIKLLNSGLIVPYSAISSLDNLAKVLNTDFNMSNSDIKKFIVEAVYNPPDNPEEIKTVCEARIKQNGIMIQTLKNMIQLNYKILGITVDEAKVLVERLDSKDNDTKNTSIKEIRNLVLKNSSQFKTKYGFDLRPLGLGVLCVTDEDLMGIENAISIDRMVTALSIYDCIVVGHGNTTSDKVEAYLERFNKDTEKRQNEVNKLREDLEKEQERIRDEFDKLKKDAIKSEIEISNAIYRAIFKIEAARKNHLHDREQYESSINKLIGEALSNGDIDKKEQLVKELNDYIKEWTKIDDKFEMQIKDLEKENNEAKAKYYDLSKQGHKTIKDVTEKYDKEIQNKYDEMSKHAEEFMSRYTRILNKYKHENHWVIQRIHTPGGKEFTDVNDLVHQLIKEGFKNIQLISCNPGTHTLDKDIRDRKDVKVTHASNTLLAEAAYLEGTNELMFYEAYDTLNDIEEHLITICNEAGINYNDDEFFNECAAYFSGDIVETLNEASLKAVWHKLGEFIKKALGFIISIFKKIINFISMVLRKISELFKKIFGGGKKLRRTIKRRFAMVEAAQFKQITANSSNDIKVAVVNACNGINKRIQQLEQKQTSNMQQLQRFAEKQERAIHESIVGINSEELNKLVLLL